MFSLGKIVSDWEEPMKKLGRDDTFWGTINKLGGALSEAGADRWIGPSGNVSVVPNTGMIMSKATDDLYQSKQAAAARKAGVKGTMPSAPTAPVAPVPAPTQVEQFQPILSTPVPTTGPYALNVGPFSGATPDLNRGTGVAVEAAPDVPRQIVTQALSQGPQPQGAHNPFLAAAEADMGLLPVETQNAVFKSIVDADAQRTGGRLQSAQAESLEAINRDPVGYHASVEKAKAMGKGDGESVAFANRVAKAEMEPVNNPIYRRLFPQAKSMGDVYRALGPEYAKQIGDLTQLMGSQATAAATEKTVLPLLTNIYTGRLKEVQDNLVKLAAKVVLPAGVPDTTSARMQFMISSGGKAFRTPEEQQMFASLQMEEQELRQGLGALEDYIIGQSGVSARRRRQETPASTTTPKASPAPAPATSDKPPAPPATFKKTGEITLSSGKKVDIMTVGSGWGFTKDKDGKLVPIKLVQ